MEEEVSGWYPISRNGLNWAVGVRPRCNVVDIAGAVWDIQGVGRREAVDASVQLGCLI
jgi:hypothetical protein